MAFDLATKFLLAKALKFGKGEIQIYDIPVILGPADCSVFLIHNLIKELGYAKAHDLIYNSLKKGNQEYCKALRKNTKAEGRDLASLYEQIVTLGGYGVANITEFSLEKKRLVCRFYNSPIANRYKEIFGKVGYCVDFVTNGLYAGSFNVLFNEDLDSVEVHCVAKGDPYCEFIYGEPEFIAKIRDTIPYFKNK